ncbi:MAG: alpha/beta hydrolase, partial [Alphaproteobacteria bacterium]|nr:alpha/beta hydrolase [Alphaproteobacteria bacterium]
RRPSPCLPCLCFVGSNERIVDLPRIEGRMARWPGGRLEILQHAEHEVLMERNALRTPLMARLTDFLDDPAGSSESALTA